eukprot:SM000079S22431  [mRNA]  locus=s79:83302:87555:- [translate_table: standard]
MVIAVAVGPASSEDGSPLPWNPLYLRGVRRRLRMASSSPVSPVHRLRFEEVTVTALRRRHSDGLDRVPQMVTATRTQASDESAHKARSKSFITLTPKREAARRRLSVGDASRDCSKVESSPDWTLDELSQELDELQHPTSSHLLPSDSKSPANKKTVSWRALSVVADFKKSAAFTMRLDNDDLAGDISDDDACSISRASPTSEARESSSTVSSKSQGKEGQQKLMWSEQRTIFQVPAGRVETTLHELERLRLSRVQEELSKRQNALDSMLLDERTAEAEALANLAKEKQLQAEALLKADREEQVAITQARDAVLERLQKDHEQRTQVGERKLMHDFATEEARRKQVAAQEEHEARIRAKAAAEARQRAEAEARAEAERKAAAEAARRERADAAAAAAAARADGDRRAKEAAQKAREEELAAKRVAASALEVAPVKVSGPRPRAAETAIETEKQRMLVLKSFEDSAAPFVANEAAKKERKNLERMIILHIQQISATQEQVRRKSEELAQLLGDQRLPQQFLILTFATKVMNQCESQVQKLPSFAFALAQVVVNVSVKIPVVMEVIMAKLHAACTYTIPKYYAHIKNQYASDIEYYKTVGYREENGQLESTDSYSARMSGYTEVGAMSSNPHGLGHAWTWCAQLLNRLPPNRFTGMALEALLKVAGYRLYMVYRRFFMKLLDVVVREYLPRLKEQGDPDIRAVVSRLETYVLTEAFQNVPEGRAMPATDASSHLRA